MRREARIGPAATCSGLTAWASGPHLRGMDAPSGRQNSANAKREAERAKALRANLRRRKTAGRAVSPAPADLPDGEASD